MTTREKVIALIDELSDAQLEAAYPKLKELTKERPSDAEFERLLSDIAEFRNGLGDVPDAAQLIRDERDWHANRVP